MRKHLTRINRKSKYLWTVLGHIGSQNTNGQYSAMAHHHHHQKPKRYGFLDVKFVQVVSLCLQGSFEEGEGMFIFLLSIGNTININFLGGETVSFIEKKKEETVFFFEEGQGTVLS